MEIHLQEITFFKSKSPNLLYVRSVINFNDSDVKGNATNVNISLFQVCKPNIDCTSVDNRWRYIEVFECLGDDKKLLKEMRLSFPSGHSSFSAYTMIYFAVSADL